MKLTLQNGHANRLGLASQSLGDLPSGGSGVVSGLNGGKEFSSRASALGLTVGAEVTMVQNFGHGPLIVTVRGTRLALGRGEAQKIQVDSR